MTEKRVLRFMTEHEHGIGDYVLDEPCRFHSLEDEQFVPAGHMLMVSYCDDDGVEHGAELWVPPAPSTGTRQPTPRTKAHSRGYIVDPKTRRTVGFSSTYELTCAMFFMANSTVIDVEDQPPAVTYVGADGAEHKHTYDYRITFANRVRHVYAVKPWRQVETTGISDIIKRTKPNLREFADDAFLLTDRTLTRALAWNCKSILKAQKVRNQADCDRMRDLIKDVHGETSAYVLARQFERFADGFNAIWCLIYDGVLELATPHEKLVDAPWVRVRANRR